MRRGKPLDLVSLVKTINLAPSCLSFLGKPKSVDVLKENVEKFQELVRQQRRFLAKRYHPDKGGDSERMKEINDACDLLLKIEVVPIRREPVFSPLRPRRDYEGATGEGSWFSFHFSFSSFSFTDTNSTHTTTGSS